MRPLNAAIATVIVAIISHIATPAVSTGIPPYPNWTVPENRPLLPETFGYADAGGAFVTGRDLHGRVLLVNFWATWCAPCVREMPELDMLHGAYDDRRVAVLALSHDRKGIEAVAPFFERHGLTRLEMLFDPGRAAARTLKVEVLPTTFLIDKQGRIAARIEGTVPWTAPPVRAAIEGLLGEPDFPPRPESRDVSRPRD